MSACKWVYAFSTSSSKVLFTPFQVPHRLLTFQVRVCNFYIDHMFSCGDSHFSSFKSNTKWYYFLIIDRLIKTNLRNELPMTVIMNISYPHSVPYYVLVS